MLHKAISKDNKLKYNLDKKKTTNSGKKTLTAVKTLKIDDSSQKAVYRILGFRDPSCFNGYANFLQRSKLYCWPLCRLGSYIPPIYVKLLSCLQA